MNNTRSAGQYASGSIDTYIRSGIAKGWSHEEIANNLRVAGWRDDSIEKAFISVAENPHASPSDSSETPEGGQASFLYVISFLTLYISVWAFINTSFGIIDSLFGEELTAINLESFRWSIAWLTVVFPVFIITNHFIKKVVPAGTENLHLTGTRKTLTYATLFVATVSLIGSAVYVVFELTGGEIVFKTVLKIFTIILVASCLFAYYFKDVKGRMAIEDSNK